MWEFEKCPLPEKRADVTQGGKATLLLQARSMAGACLAHHLSAAAAQRLVVVHYAMRPRPHISGLLRGEKLIHFLR